MPKPKVKIEKNSDEEKEFAELLRERENDGHIDESLKEIYQNESALNLASSSKNTKHRSLKRKEMNPWAKIGGAFLALLFLMSLISWTGFFLLNSGNRLNTSDIEFEITGPENTISGKEEIYEIKYKNLSKFNLKDIEIFIDAPQNFIIIDAAPEVSDKKNTWKIDQIDMKRSGRLALKAKAIGKIDEEVNLRATINYRPENFSSTFGNEDSFSLKITSTGVASDIEMPSFLNLNEESDFIVKYSKEKESYIDSFAIVFEHASNFEIAEENKQGIWIIENIPETQETLEIKGQYKTRPEPEDKLIIKLAVPREIEVENRNGDEVAKEIQKIYLPFYEKEIAPTVVEGALSLSLTVNSSASNKPVNFSDRLNYIVHYKNTSEAELKNVIIMATIDSAVVDWKSLDDEYGGEVRDNTIIWTKAEISDLESVSPDEEDSFSFSIQVKNKDEVEDIALNDLAVRTYVDYSVNSAIADTTTHAAEITNPINADVDFTSELRYFDRNNIAVGEGPLPPKVGEKTIYQTYWFVKSSLHDLQNASITTTLPENINWESKTFASSGSISYNSDTREVKWSIGEVNVIGEPAAAQFAVSLTPTEAEKNKIITILKPARLEARDSETSGVIIVESAAKTSNLEDDEVGKGYGKVE